MLSPAVKPQVDGSALPEAGVVCQEDCEPVATAMAEPQAVKPVLVLLR